MSDQDGRPLTPRAESAVGAFLTGGLPGLLGALDTGESSDDDIEDPEALRRAEDAVAHESRETVPRSGPASRRIDEPWTAVAMQVTPGDSAGLEDVVRALESEGIDIGWDPYDPRDTVSFTAPVVGVTARKVFSILVPVSQVPRARECLYGTPPQGVTYVFPTEGAGPAAAEGAASVGPDADYGFESSPARTRQLSKDGIPLSDNRRLERTAGDGPSVLVMVIVAVTTVSVLIIIIGTLITVFGLR